LFDEINTATYSNDPPTIAKHNFSSILVQFSWTKTSV